MQAEPTQMGLEISIPGKVFLIGEYLALAGGECILAANEPRFVFRADLDENSKKMPFHENSPAGKLWLGRIKKKWRVQFRDPYKGTGGFGGSTAEYLFVNALLRFESGVEEDHWQTWQQYREINANSNGPTPSGADLLAQMIGGVAQVSTREHLLKTCAWPFSDLGFLLVKTPFKLPTHEHLQTLHTSSGQLSFSTEELTKASQSAMSSMRQKRSDLWVTAINEFAQSLDRLGFVAPTTKALIAGLPQGAALAAKGCGALGADVIVVFYHQSNAGAEVLLRRYFESRQCSVVGSEKSLSNGLQTQILASRRQT